MMRFALGVVGLMVAFWAAIYFGTHGYRVPVALLAIALVVIFGGKGART